MILFQRFLPSLVFLFIFINPSSAQLPRLKISDNHRYIITENGKPFLWLGDTAWELFHRLNREEASEYIANRALKGFNVVQAVVLAEFNGLTEPNRYGNLPLIDLDPQKPNPKYFEHIDFIVQQANESDIYIAMLPTWGDKFNKRWGIGPEVFDTENAYQYGLFLGKRYKNSGIIWVLGGDRIPEEEQDFQIIEAMAKGLQEGDGGTHLITYHPMGGNTSSNFFHNSSWLDINMFQSGHGERDYPNFNMVTSDYRKTPVKPVLDGEPCYEDHPVNWNTTNGWFDEFDSRRAGYWAMLSGACGHTYGNHNIWQMLDKVHPPVSAARTPWQQAIDHPGAFQAGYMRKFFESRPFQLLVPSGGLILKGPNASGRNVIAAIASDNSYMMVYTPFGSTINIKLEAFEKQPVKIWWFNPRNCTVLNLDSLAAPENMEFDPPAEEARGNDWVLVVEKSSANFSDPKLLIK
jgi:hypothetical protein